MAKFLTENQTTELQKNWIVKPDGVYITLYKDEFKPDVWKQYAKIVGFDATKKSVKVLCFGHYQK